MACSPCSPVRIRTASSSGDREILPSPPGRRVRRSRPCERLLHLIQLERLDDGLDLLHEARPPQRRLNLAHALPARRPPPYATMAPLGRGAIDPLIDRQGGAP